MFQKLAAEWREFRQSKPGRRFRDRYDRNSASTRAQSRWRRALIALLGIVLVAVGLFLLPLPGPGALVILLGLTLLSSASARVTDLLDAAELRLRALAARTIAWWRRATAPIRMAVVGALGAVGAAGGYLLYGWLLG